MAYALHDNYGRNYPVGTKLQIGRDPTNKVVLLDPQVTPVNVMLWEQQGILYLQDGSGGSATFVNQARVHGTVALQTGDQVTTGSTRFTVVDLKAQPAVPMQAPKKRIGCLQWLMIGAGMFIVEVLLLVAAGFFIYQTDVEIQGGLQDLQQLVMSSPQTGVSSPPTGVDQPGPEILKLNDPWLGSNYTGSFTQNDARTVESVTPAGAAIKTSFVFTIMEQITPEWLSYSMVRKIANDKVITQLEAGIVKGVRYSGSKTCASSADPQEGNHGIDGAPQNILTNEFTGHVKRVETGVTINGVITDRYELRQDNFVAADTLVNFKSGSLYRARNGGYLVQLEYVVTIKPQSWPINMSDDYSTTQPSQVTYHFDRTYAPEGKLTAKVPQVCAGQVK